MEATRVALFCGLGGNHTHTLRTRTQMSHEYFYFPILQDQSWNISFDFYLKVKHLSPPQ